MDRKQCFKCKEDKVMDEFYRHPRMADGRLNKCKDCTRKDTRENRAGKLEFYREYDRKRGNRQGSEYVKEYRERYPSKARAHRLLNYNLAKGYLVKEPCEVCGSEKVVAHHDDYALPLKVRWLCQGHHKQWHAKHGEGLNP